MKIPCYLENRVVRVCKRRSACIKSTVKNSSIFVAFLENMCFNSQISYYGNNKAPSDLFLIHGYMVNLKSWTPPACTYAKMEA